MIDLEPKEEITFEDFGKMQFQVGEIISCEPVKKSKKLLCFQVKVGSQTRQIVSGIKAYYKPEDTIGMKVMVLTNLKPAKLAGMMSEGMLLCAEDAEGNVCLMTPEKYLQKTECEQCPRSYEICYESGYCGFGGVLYLISPLPIQSLAASSYTTPNWPGAMPCNFSSETIR